MLATINYSGQTFSFDLSRPIDISIAVGQVKCFYATDFIKEPYTSGDFIGSVQKGSSVNFYNLKMNPHGNGTHTECLGHISLAHESINDQLSMFHFVSALVSVPYIDVDGDKVICLDQFKKHCHWDLPNALIIRSMPNDRDKLTMDYSGTNPAYLEEALVDYLVEQGVQHLLIDLPSVDREVDGGKLKCHKAFWQVGDVNDTQDNPRKHCTITELVFVPNEVEDGLFMLNLQIPSIDIDAVPSKPVLYQLTHQKEIQ